MAVAIAAGEVHAGMPQHSLQQAAVCIRGRNSHQGRVQPRHVCVYIHVAGLDQAHKEETHCSELKGIAQRAREPQEDAAVLSVQLRHCSENVGLIMRVARHCDAYEDGDVVGHRPGAW